MSEQLTEQQREAVINRGGSLLVSAAAGSGKTKVLVDRLLSYIMDPVDPANLDDFLIITYTHAAAAELRGKIASKLTEHIAQNPGNRHLQQQMQRLYLAKISTVHSFCSDLVKEFAYCLDVSGDFRVADENECLELQARALDTILNEAYSKINEDPEIQALIDTQGFGRDDQRITEVILKAYTSARCHLDPDGWLEWCSSSTHVENATDAGETIWGRYLINDFREYLKLQITAMRNITSAAEHSDNMQKPYAVLQAALEQLERLYEQDTWEGIRAHSNVNYGTLTFPKSCTDSVLIDQIKAVRDACKKGVGSRLEVFTDSSDVVLQNFVKTSVSLRGLVALTKRFTYVYEQLKQNRRVLDFGDLEHRTLDLLMGKKRSGVTKLAEEIGRRFREVMVDEYQDSNAVQDAIFSALTQERGNCFMVGDVKQSIYQFRLADPGIFLEKYNHYSTVGEAKPGQGRKVILSSNFRSGQAVIDAVNDVFTTCMSPAVGGLVYNDDEALNVGIARETLNEPEVELRAIRVKEDTYAEETAYVAQRIQELLDGDHYIRSKDTLRPITPGDIVILLRSPGSVGAYFRYALQNLGIPCVTDKSSDLLQEEEITVLISFLQVIDNPLQDIPLVAVLSSRIFQFSADDLAQIRSPEKKCSFYASLRKSDIPKVNAFLEVLGKLRVEAKSLSITQLIEKIFTVTRMDSIYSAMPDGDTRTENLHAFCQLAAGYESNCQYDLGKFLEHLNLLSEKGFSLSETKEKTDSVTIMSIHKSKGLEFPVVFLCGLSRDFNRKSAREQVLCDKDLGIGLFCVDMEKRVRYPSIARRAIAAKILLEGLSEEMRVLYVAMTRACDRLIMTYASNRLEKELNSLSMRLQMSDKELLIREADCPGKWILLTALSRTESGALFSLLETCHHSSVKPSPWCVSVEDVDLIEAEASFAQIPEKTLDAADIALLEKSLSFSYGHKTATKMPSKQTATQLKGRSKDQEVSQYAAGIKQQRRWRKPEFIEPSQDGTAYGKLIHRVMQCISLDKCKSISEIERELQRLVDEEIISSDQYKSIDSRKLASFFDCQIGQAVLACNHVLREFKFSILDDGVRYAPELAGEKVLLQGVVDCALIEPDGITVIDFKTDILNEDMIAPITESYRQQVDVYADALAKIYKLDVKAKFIYYFHIDDFVQL